MLCERNILIDVKGRVMKFQREKAQDVFKEMIPLLEKHWEEIAHYKDIPLDPDFNIYFNMEDLDMLRVFTARDDENTLIGYAVFFIKANAHYRSSLQALQDVLFIKPDCRGTGLKFIVWCDNQLQKEKIQVVYHHVKQSHNFGSALERIGYKLVDLIYARRLD